MNSIDNDDEIGILPLANLEEYIVSQTDIGYLTGYPEFPSTHEEAENQYSDFCVQQLNSSIHQKVSSVGVGNNSMCKNMKAGDFIVVLPVKFLAVLAIDMKLTEEQKDIYVDSLKFNTPNFDEVRFRKVMMIEYNNRCIAGEFVVGGI